MERNRLVGCCSYCFPPSTPVLFIVICWECCYCYRSLHLLEVSTRLSEVDWCIVVMLDFLDFCFFSFSLVLTQLEESNWKNLLNFAIQKSKHHHWVSRASRQSPNRLNQTGIHPAQASQGLYIRYIVCVGKKNCNLFLHCLKYFFRFGKEYNHTWVRLAEIADMLFSI